MNQLLDACVKFFQEDDWPHEVAEGAPLVRSRYAGSNGNVDCWFQVREEQGHIIFYSRCPINAPEGKRAAIAEFITRANYGLYIGNFEMDYSDGEIRYKTSADVEETVIGNTFLKNLTYMNLSIMNRYLPGIMKVIYSDTSPADAIVEVES